MKKIFGKTILYTFAIVFIALCNSSCSNEPLDGDWDSMEWQKAVTEKVIVNGVNCYHIPIQGGTCQFKCKNYNGFWINHARILGAPSWVDAEAGDYIFPAMTDGTPRDNQHVSADGLKVSIEGNTMNVTFDENQSFAKYVEVVVTAGDIFDTFRFVQDSPLYTE